MIVAGFQGVTSDASFARGALTRVKDIPGVAARISRSLSDHGINIRLIIQGIRHDQINDVSLTIAEEDAPAASAVIEEVADGVGTDQVEVNVNVAKVSVIGSGTASISGVAARMFQVLADEGINNELISTSEVHIVCILQKDKLDTAVRAIHREFGLAHLKRRKIGVCV